MQPHLITRHRMPDFCKFEKSSPIPRVQLLISVILRADKLYLPTSFKYMIANVGAAGPSGPSKPCLGA